MTTFGNMRVGLIGEVHSATCMTMVSRSVACPQFCKPLTQGIDGT